MRIPFVTYVPFYLHVPVRKMLRKYHSDCREPDVFIGGRTNTYLRRWYVIPHNKWFNIYLHQFLRSDDDRALHDHPWWNISWVLSGGYHEITAPSEKDLPPGGRRKESTRWAGALAFRSAKTAHRIRLMRCGDSEEMPVWTLFITGPKIRVWGFWCREGWVAFDSKARSERRLNPGGPDGPCPN